MHTRRELAKGLAAVGAALWLDPPRVWSLGSGAEEVAIRGVPVSYRTLPVDALPRIEADINRILRHAAVSDHPTFRSYLENRQYGPPQTMPDARSVVILAIADRRYELDVRIGGALMTVPIPPGYTTDEVSEDDVQAFVRQRVLGNDSARLEPARLPVKLVAARTGLAGYGKNNISYVPGLGSFHRLRAFFTEQSCPPGVWRAVKPLHLCKGCSICEERCPTKAIRPDRFVLDAGRCVTLYNELPDPMPGWMPPSAHNALVGCTLCQWPCPANVEALKRVEKLAELSEDETTMLLSGALDEKLGASVAKKIARNGLSGDLTHLARNLKLVVHARNLASGAASPG